MAMTVISGVIGSVDSVAKEIKINKLEKELDELENKGKVVRCKVGQLSC